LDADSQIKGLAKLFGSDMHQLWDLYPMMEGDSVDTHAFASQLKFVMDANRESGLVEAPVVKRELYRPHKIRRVMKDDKLTGYESTGADWFSFSANPASTKFDVLEIGGTLNGIREGIENWRNNQGPSSNKKAWDAYIDQTLDWYDRFRSCKDGETSCFEQIRKQYQLPSRAKVVWLLDLDPLTQMPIGESDYMHVLATRMKSFESYYGPFTPVFLAVKTDYFMAEKARDRILHVKTPPKDGINRLLNLGFSSTQAPDIQKRLADPAPPVFQAIYDKVQQAVDRDLGVGTVVGGGSLFEKGHYQELVRSVLSIAGAH
jgi:hypothetical protein